ncbi:MAG: hypothetical protein ACKVXR_09580 [Planctomycetota bacterium]
MSCMAVLGLGLFAAHASLEARIDERLGRIRQATRFSREPRSPETRELVARLEAIDRWVVENASDDGLPPPWLRDAEDVVDLPEKLEAMAPFFQQVDVLTDSEACTRILADDERLDMPTRRLFLARMCTNLLCAQAWFDQHVEGDSAAAARRLGQALDIARLGDDGSMIGFMIDLANEQYVLLAVQQVFLKPQHDARVFHEALECRLARIDDPDRLRRTLVLEFEEFRARVPGRNLLGLVRELQCIETLERALALAGATGAESEAGLPALEAQSGDYAFTYGSAVKCWQLARTHAELGRAALAVAARSEAPLPIDPHTNRPFARETTAEGERISSPEAIATLGDPSEPYLLSWTLPR